MKPRDDSLLRLSRAVDRTPAALSYHDFATAPDYCGLALSPLMARIMRETDVAGTRTVAVRAGARGGKTSRLLACKALHAAWSLPLPPGFGAGEFASAMLVAPDMDLARQALSFVIGYVEGSKALSRALLSPPTRQHVELRRPDGHAVRIEIRAASQRGRATRGRTLVFAGLDEACFFRDEITGAINDQDVYDSVMARLVPGGQCWIVSTPWLSGVGLLEQLIEQRPPHTAVYLAPTRELNPSWDPDGSIEAALRASDPDKARREIDAIPLSSGAVQFFDGDLIVACVDASLTLPRQARPGEHVGAGGDFGFRSDSSAVVVVHQDHAAIRVADILELKPEPGVPLKPSETVRTIGARLAQHAGLTHLWADQHYQETVSEHLAESGIGYAPAPLDVAETYVKARALMREGRVKLPNHPRLLAQLRSVQWRPNPGGSISIVLPREKSGGHCDLVSALVLALWQSASVEVPEPEPEVGTRAYWAKVEQDTLERMKRQIEKRAEEASW